MQIIKSSATIFDEIDGYAILKKIERIGRRAYRSEKRILEIPHQFVRDRLFPKDKDKIGHWGLAEHVSVTCDITTDRGISHEAIRHRLASILQESTRYVRYSDDPSSDKEIEFVCPAMFDYDELVQVWQRKKDWGTLLENIQWENAIQVDMADWIDDMVYCEQAYIRKLKRGWLPEQARGVLMHDVATRFYITANLTEWHHILNLRACDASGRAHPNMHQIMRPLLQEFKEKIPVIFEDLSY
jgi:thymidylate synthase (FAD)